VGIWTGVTLAIVALGLVGLRLYLDTQWFVGVSNGRVAIFRGVPAEVGGFELHSVVVETSIPADGPSPSASTEAPRRHHGGRPGRCGGHRGEHPRGRRPVRAVHPVSRAAAPKSRTSLAPSVAFTILA
jgi:hypothetical protein